MYFDYFGLKEAPFRITPNPEYWHAGGQRGELLAALLYAISHGEGIIKVVGEVGSGKTMLCRKLVAQLPKHVDSVYLGNPTLDADDMLGAILAELGESPASGRQARLAQLDAVLLARHEAGRRVVVVVEEAQGIAPENLEFLRLLTNLETSTDKLLQIVLFGQPELDAVLADPRIRQLKDRVTVSLDLPPLADTEVGDYLRTRLAVAGYRGPDLFPAALVARIARLSGGLSRRINVLADRTLLAAYAAQTHTLSREHLDAAARDVDLQPASSGDARASRRRRWAWLAGALAVVLGLLIFVAWQARATAAGPRLAPTGQAKEASPASVLQNDPLAAIGHAGRDARGVAQGHAGMQPLDARVRATAAATLRGPPDAAAGNPFLRTMDGTGATILPTGR